MHRLALTAALLASTLGTAHAADPITGRWLTEGGQAIVAIERCGGVLCGKLARILKAPAGAASTDANNPDKRLRSRPLVGVPILSGFTDAGSDWRGTIYDPKSGKSYRSIVRAEGNALAVKGCIAMFCRTQRWTRVR